MIKFLFWFCFSVILFTICPALWLFGLLILIPIELGNASNNVKN